MNTMSKKDSDAREIPNYEAFTTIEDVDKEIERHKQILVGKDVLESHMKRDKKEYVSAINEQLKELSEEREHEIDVISALEQRKQIINAAGSNVIPMPKVAGI
jgi:hypothetical protein